MRVLVAVDGSVRSQRALCYVASLLSHQKDDLILYYSPPNIKLAGSGAEIAPNIPAIARESLANAVFDEAKGRLPPEFQAVTKVIVGEQKPAKGILAAAAAEEAGLIVVADHGTRKRFQLFVGGTARYVAHHAEVPVLIVRGEGVPTADHSGLIVACDGDGAWCESSRVLRELSWPDGTQCTMLTVLEGLNVDEYESVISAMPNRQKLVGEYREFVERRKEEAVQNLVDGAKDMTPILRHASAKAVHGNVVERLIEEVEETQANLVVVSARGSTPLNRFLGSTTEGLLAHCPSSVLICHQHGKP